MFCGEVFIPTGSSHKFCTKDHQYQWQKQEGIQKEYRDRANAKMGRVVGIGSGGLTGIGPKNYMYSHGRDAFRNLARRLIRQGVPCNRCGKDLTNASRGNWCGHHIDHDPTNNVIINLEILCKRCHQLEHDAGQNLNGRATTISKESTG